MYMHVEVYTHIAFILRLPYSICSALHAIALPCNYLYDSNKNTCHNAEAFSSRNDAIPHS